MLKGQHFQELLDNLESTADAKQNKADRECEEFKLQIGSGSAHLQKMRTAIARVEMEINALAEKIPAIIAEAEARSKEAEKDVKRQTSETQIIEYECRKGTHFTSNNNSTKRMQL